jgi:SAM-dependent methyltransferase
MRKAAWVVSLLVIGAGLWICAPDRSEGATIPNKPALDVIYEPTSYPIVEAMLNMASVTSDDLVYDLGCGDGRIVITASKLRGSKGVGVDLDPERVKESRQNARKAGVTDKVVFYEQNLFKTDISHATVVMIYLFPEVNLRLRPRLLRELSPGTRIVSHSHTMGEWKSDLTRKVGGHDLHFFVVPANMSGTWKGMETEGMPTSLSLTQKFQQVNGKMTIGSETYPIRNCSLEGKGITFTLERKVEGAKKLLFFKGQVSGDTLEGSIVHEGGPYTGDAWKAVREPSTKVSIAK